MQVHEITLKEGVGEWVGLNNPTTQAALGNLAQTAAATFTKDPRYKDLPMDQRIDVMARDMAVAKTARDKTQEFAEYYKQALYNNQNRPLGPNEFKALMYNYLSRKVFGYDVAKLNPEFRQKLDALINQAQRTNFDYRTGFSPEFEATMKEIIALSFVARYQSTAQPAQKFATTTPPPPKITTPPAAGAPTPAEQAKLQQMIQQKLGTAK